MKTTLPPSTGVREPGKWRRRQPIEASKLNELRDAVRSLLPFAQPARQVAASGKEEVSEIAQMQIVGVAGDYLQCRKYSGTSASGPTVSVAKPYLLRKTPFNGASRNGISYSYTSDVSRTASLSGETETQVVVPSYVVGDIIYAIKGVVGGVGVTLTAGTISWLDLNVDGRAWAKEAE